MKDLKQNLLRFNQREQLTNEITEAEAMLKHAKADEVGAVKSRINKTKHQLNSQSPEPLTGKEKDTLHALEKKLRAKITTNMPTEEVMRKNPAGAVDWHTRWERANKSAIKMWKNIRIQLNPESQDRDLANIERYRPSGQTDRMRTDAQIPGLMSYGNIEPEDWPFPEPQNTALKQAERVHDENTAEEQVNAALDEIDRREKEEHVVESDDDEPKYTIEQQARIADNLRKAREAKAAKRLAEQQVEDISDATPVSMAD